MKSISNGFVGHFKGFTGTATTDLPANTIVTSGTLVGVTHQPFSQGDTFIAFMGQGVDVYNFTLAETATSAMTVGTPIYIDTNGKATTTATSNTLVGFVWNAVSTGATTVDVALALYTPYATNT
ncbi:MAG: DUF2190 family protein [Planctomycetia bacterium]|nr:DUF2190 family protein [Planctomycetia bacterium]